MDLSSYKDKLGIKEETQIIENKIKSEKRYFTIIQYTWAKSVKKIYKAIGSHEKAIKNPKESWNLAKQDLLHKVSIAKENGALSIIVIEQLWATVRSSHNLLSIEEYIFQPINTRYLTWDEIKELCLEPNSSNSTYNDFDNAQSQIESLF